MELTNEMELVVNTFCGNNKELKEKILNGDQETIEKIGEFGRCGFTSQEIIDNLTKDNKDDFYEEVLHKYLAKKIFYYFNNHKFIPEVMSNFSKNRIETIKKLAYENEDALNELEEYGNSNASAEEILVAYNNNEFKRLIEQANDKKEALNQYEEIINSRTK